MVPIQASISTLDEVELSLESFFSYASSPIKNQCSKKSLQIAENCYEKENLNPQQLKVAFHNQNQFSLDNHRQFVVASVPKAVRRLPNSFESIVHEFCRLFNDRRSILLEKHDFVSPSMSSIKRIQIKSQSLNELNTLVRKLQAAEIPDIVFHMLYQLLNSVVFQQKPLNFNPKGPAFDPEEDEPAFATDWEHLQLLYRILFGCLENSCLSSSFSFLKYFGSEFALRFFYLLKSEDNRERDCLIAIFHRYYRLFFGMRRDLRKFIYHFLHESLHETPYEYAGITEILKISISIVNGFQVPLKAENLVFFRRHLLPLHRSPILRMFSEPLACVMDRFMCKDSSLSVELISYLLSHWPSRNMSKESILYLNQLEEALHYAQNSLISHSLQQALIGRIKISLLDDHFQLCERALKIFHSPFMLEWGKQEPLFFYSSFVPTILDISKLHWCHPIRFIANAILTVYAANNYTVFSKFISTIPIHKNTQSQSKFNLFCQKYAKQTLSTNQTNLNS